MSLIFALLVIAGHRTAIGPTVDAVGMPVDIASSAYQYRADRAPSANAPESWLALMHFAHVPLNAVDIKSPILQTVTTALLWEEIRPIQSVKLTWSPGAKRIPPASMIQVNALMNQGGSSSWWNNLRSTEVTQSPSFNQENHEVTIPIGLQTCGIVLSLKGGAKAADFDTPKVNVLVADVWKQMDVEIEWGFEPGRKSKDYSGRLTTYDGRISSVQPIEDDFQTRVDGPLSWSSKTNASPRRGIKISLLYMGTSKWRKVQPYTSQPDDVSRSIVTVWTRSGSFSFLASDLENGPILAPEYGFFVRRLHGTRPSKPVEPTLNLFPSTLSAKMNEIAGQPELKGWGSDETPWFGSNPTSEDIDVLGIHFPEHSVAMHPGQSVDVVAEWKSPISGLVTLQGSLTHAQAGSNGVDWWAFSHHASVSQLLAHGNSNGSGSQRISSLKPIRVEVGDTLSIVVGPKGDHRCDTNLLEMTVAEVGGAKRFWNLADDVAADPLAGNPHADRFGNPNVWRFCSEIPLPTGSTSASEPPIDLQSKAKTATEYVSELKTRNLQTIRQATRSHAEPTWEDAVTATRGSDLPPHPAPPIGSEPVMKVDVPSARLTSQWNLSTWHLLRHCAANPKTGKLWFNDFPYGILAAETYLVLSVLDQIGSHDAAADGFDQWLSLPLDRNPPGTDPAHMLPAHPVGLFSEGQGAFTYAEGPDGYGGQMDGIHAFGPGSIGWALTQHFWMTGDKAWLKANASRLIANAEWMLRQRKLNEMALPGGARLWCKGLQPALQVTPDSGGLWMQFYECEAYYWASVSRLATTLAEVDPSGASRLKKESEQYRKDLLCAVERSITLSPVVPIRDGTFHSVLPFACYVRGLSNGAWGWQREGSGSHVGPLYWDTVQTGAALVSPAELLPTSDVRIQGYLDVLEDRLLLENENVGTRNWFYKGWQYQGGLERQANMHLAADDIPVFLRSFFNCYAVDILPKDGYVFNEHAVHGPPDKIFEEAAFIERFRNLLVMESGSTLWIGRGTPRSWLEDGKHISVKYAPTAFGDIDFDITSHVKSGRIIAKISVPGRKPATAVLLRLRHPESKPIRSVSINGKPWRDFDPVKEIVKLNGFVGQVTVEVTY